MTIVDDLTAYSALDDWQFEIGGLVFGANTPYEVISVAGIEDMPEVRSGDSPFPQNHGELMGLDLLGGRDLAFVLNIVSDGVDLEHAIDALKAATATPSFFGQPLVQEIPLSIQMPNLPELVANVRKRDLKFQPLDVAFVAGMADKVSLLFHATDPRLYSAQQTITVPLGTTFEVSNPGTFSGGTWPLMTFTGSDIVNPCAQIWNASTPINLQFAQTVATSMIVDNYNRRASNDGTNVLGSIYTTHTWWAIPPGTWTVTLTADSYEDGATGTIVWSPAWGE